MRKAWPEVRACVTVGVTSQRGWPRAPARAAVAGARGYEVGREDGLLRVVLVVEALLPLANHAEEAVVDDGDVDGHLLLLQGGELSGGHLEAAVAGDDPDVFFRAGCLGADGGGQSEAHGAQAARGDEGARRVVAEV